MFGPASPHGRPVGVPGYLAGVYRGLLRLVGRSLGEPSWGVAADVW